MQVTIRSIGNSKGIVLPKPVLAQAGLADISFTVPADDLAQALDVTRGVARTLGAGGVSHDDSMAKVSVVGVGMAREEGVAGKMFQALSRQGINVRMITTSEIKISVLIDRADCAKAVKAAHAAGLGVERAEVDDIVEVEIRTRPRRGHRATGGIGGHIAGVIAEVKAAAAARRPGEISARRSARNGRVVVDDRARPRRRQPGLRERRKVPRGPRAHAALFGWQVQLVMPL